MTRERYFGKPIRRREDFRYLTGHGTYTSDVRVPNPLHMKVVRSVYPHARIRRISTEAARVHPRSAQGEGSGV